jgi:hypothetical protein
MSDDKDDDIYEDIHYVGYSRNNNNTNNKNIEDDNETIHTQPIVIPKFTEDAKIINERQKRIDLLKSAISLGYYELTELETQMKNLSNNNNNNNVDLNIMKQIKDIQKQIDNYSNELDELENEQIKSKKIYYKTLIEDRENFLKIQNDKLKIIKKTIRTAKDEIDNSKKRLLNLPITVPNKEGYEIDNGILGAKRDINIKLMSKLSNENENDLIQTHRYILR